MSSQKDHQFKENLERCYNIVQQSSTRGISAVEVAKKLGKHRTTVHGYLNTLEYMGRVESQHGTWHAKTGEQTIKPLEKEIVIELPMPKNLWQHVAILEAYAKECEDVGYPEIANLYRIILEGFNETRTIKIKGKNVDDLDLEKLGNLIQQANEKSSKVNLRGLFKGLKKSLPISK
jgi:DNA-binding Lrp family transcriptional regulator